MSGDLTMRHKADEDRIGYAADCCLVCRMSAAGDNFAAWPPLLVGPAIVAIAVAFIRMGIAGRRETLRWATLHLANALGPVRPTDAELERGLASLRDRQLWLGSKARVEKLQAAFEEQRLRPRSAC